MSRSLMLMAAITLFSAFPVPAQERQDVQAHKSCKYCGMDRGAFDHTRMLIEYEDGSSAGFCSVHCAALELALVMDKTPKAIKVGDMGTKQLIDAETAHWVIGGAKPGVMSRQGKWAFQRKQDAEAFQKTNGGRLGTFEDAMKASFDDLYEDSKMIREKRRTRMQKMQHGQTHGH